MQFRLCIGGLGGSSGSKALVDVLQVMLDHRTILTLYRLFGWFLGVWGIGGWICLIVKRV